MLRCPACNIIQPDHSTRCQACGAALTRATPPSAPQPAQPPQQHPQQYPQYPQQHPQQQAQQYPQQYPQQQAQQAASVPTSGPAIQQGIAPQQVLVGPMGPPGGSRGTSKSLIAVVIGMSALVLVLVVAIGAVLVKGGDRPHPLTSNDSGTTQITSDPTPAPSSATTTHSSGDVSVALTATSSKVNSGDAITVQIDFNGDPAEVASTTLVLGGLPTDQRVDGLHTQFSIPATFAGTIEVKVLLTLKDGRTIETNPVTVTVATTTTPTTAPSVASCPNIGFTPQSDDVASSIVATGVGCDEALALVRAVRYDPSRSHHLPAINGFSCDGTEATSPGLGHTQWVCTSGPRRVTWNQY